MCNSIIRSSDNGTCVIHITVTLFHTEVHLLFFLSFLGIIVNNGFVLLYFFTELHEQNTASIAVDHIAYMIPLLVTREIYFLFLLYVFIDSF